MTFDQVLDFLFSIGCNNADIALGRMMDMIENETGNWPNWSDEAPQWVLDECRISRR